MEQSTIDPQDGEIHFAVPKPHNLNVTLSSDINEKLSRLATAQGLSKSVIIRRSIDWLYQMHVQQIPVCANGQRCYVPNLHPPPAQAPHQTLVAETKPT